MDFVASFIAWLDWQADRHLDLTAMAAVVMVANDTTNEEALWWGCNPIRARALVGACIESGLMRPGHFVTLNGWSRWEWDYDIRDLRDFANDDHERRIREVRWTLNRLRERQWGKWVTYP